MDSVMFVMIGAVTLASFLSGLQILPAAFKFLPELMSALVVVYVVMAGVRQRFHLVNVKYWLVFGALGIVLGCGALANSVDAGPLLSGMRYYFRAVPFFFLPAVYDFQDWQLRRYLRVLLALCLLQVPVAVYQRYTIMATAHYSNADAVMGTLGHSGILSLFLICALCLLAAATLRGRLSKLVFGLCFFLFVVPMSINETKVTVFLLPLGLLTTFILGAPPSKRLRTALAGVSILLVGGAFFVPVFDYYQSKTVVPYKISDFFTKKGELTGYLDNEAAIGSDKEAGRVDAVTVPLQQLARDPVTLAFGVGLGNASRSNLGSNFTGVYYGIYGRYTLETSVAAFLLETGLLGLGLILLLHWLILCDTWAVAWQDDGLTGTIALGFIGAMCVVTIGLSYVTIHVFESLSYMFWFFAGLMAARRQRLAISEPGRRTAVYQMAMATMRAQAPNTIRLGRSVVANTIGSSCNSPR